MSRSQRKSAKPGNYSVGKGKPPEEHQIKPGEVRNRWGRAGKPKAKPIELHAQLPSQRMFLEEGTRLVRVRSGEGTEELPTSQVVMRALAAEAMKPGNILAKREYLRRLDQVEAIEFAHRREIFEYWKKHAADARVLIEQAKAKVEPEPRILPHPDDILLNYTDLTVRIVGPINEAEAAKTDRTFRLKHLMYEMAIYDGPDIENEPDTPLGQRWVGLWTLFYIQAEFALPKRLRGISDEFSEAMRLRMVFGRRWRAYLQERFAAECIPFFLVGHCESAAFRLDDLMEKAGYEGGWGSWAVEAP